MAAQPPITIINKDGGTVNMNFYLSPVADGGTNQTEEIPIDERRPNTLWTPLLITLLIKYVRMCPGIWKNCKAHKRPVAGLYEDIRKKMYNRTRTQLTTKMVRRKWENLRRTYEYQTKKLQAQEEITEDDARRSDMLFLDEVLWKEKSDEETDEDETDDEIEDEDYIEEEESEDETEEDSLSTLSPTCPCLSASVILSLPDGKTGSHPLLIEVDSGSTLSTLRLSTFRMLFGSDVPPMEPGPDIAIINFDGSRIEGVVLGVTPINVHLKGRVAADIIYIVEYPTAEVLGRNFLQPLGVFEPFVHLG